MYKILFVIFVLVIMLLLPSNITSVISETIETDVQLSWLQQNYLPSEVGTIQLVDSSMNKLEYTVETISVHVWSDTDLNGIIINLHETNNNSGIFNGKVMFTYDLSNENTLQISDGDEIFVEYVNKNLTSELRYEIISKGQIAIVDIPVAKINVSNMRIIDVSGTLIKNISVDARVQISMDLENQTNETQPFIHILQIENTDGVIVQMSWIEGDLYPKQKFYPSSSWLPFENGEYTITSFVWKSFDNPIVLAPSISKIIMVHP